MMNFEDAFMEEQSELIALCLEAVGNKADKVFAYASIEKKSQSFNAFFQIGNEIKTLNLMGIDEDIETEFLDLGTNDLDKIRHVCEKYNMPIPTEMKMTYDIRTGKYDADYRYDEICSVETGISSYTVFINWMNEVKANL